MSAVLKRKLYRTVTNRTISTENPYHSCIIKGNNTSHIHRSIIHIHNTGNHHLYHHSDNKHYKSTKNQNHSHNYHKTLLFLDATRSFCSNPNSNSDDIDTNNNKNKNEDISNTNETPKSIQPNVDDKIDRRAWPIAASSLLMGIGIGIILPVMPLFANEIGINTMQYGLVISVMGVTRLIMNIPAGVLCDKIGRKPLLVGGPILSSLGTLVLAMCTSFNELVFSRLINGAGGSLQMAGAQAYLSDISTIRNRSRTMAPLVAAFSAGAAVGPAIGGWLCDYYDSVRTPFFFVSFAIAAVAMNNFAMLPETLKKKKTKTNDDGTIQKESILHQFKATLAEWKVIIKDRKNTMSCVALHTSFWFLQAGATFTLMPLFVTNHMEGGMSATSIGGIFAMMSIINIIGSQPFAWIADKYGRKKTIVPAVMIIASMVPLIPLVTNIQELYYLMFVYSIGGTMLGTAPTAYIADIYSGSKDKEKHRSQALAMLRSGGDFGLMMGSGALGAMTHFTGSFIVPMSTASVVLFIAGINFAVNARETVNASHHKKL